MPFPAATTSATRSPRQPQDQIDDVNSAAEHERRIIGNTAAPPGGQFFKPPIEIVGLDIEQAAEPALPDPLAQIDETRRGAQDQVGRQPQFWIVSQPSFDGAELFHRKAQRLFHKNVLAAIECAHHLCGVGVVEASNRDDIDGLMLMTIAASSTTGMPG